LYQPKRLNKKSEPFSYLIDTENPLTAGFINLRNQCESRGMSYGKPIGLVDMLDAVVGN
jgi:hypothetical protein